MKQSNKYIISLGGSLISKKDGVDWKFLKNFKELILKEIKKGKTFFLITGGGSLCREYMMVKKISKSHDFDLDKLGIECTRLNANLVKTLFGDKAHKEIITNPNKKVRTNKKIIISGGYEPGNSSDYVAVLLAKKYGCKHVINLSNIDYVYDKDPKKYKSAKKIESMNWKDFIKIVGDKWIPGANVPFDPIASKSANKFNMEVAIINGNKLNNLKNYIKGDKFQGTIIKN